MRYVLYTLGGLSLIILASFTVQQVSLANQATDLLQEARQTRGDLSTALTTTTLLKQIYQAPTSLAANLAPTGVHAISTTHVWLVHWRGSLEQARLQTQLQAHLNQFNNDWFRASDNALKLLRWLEGYEAILLAMEQNNRALTQHLANTMKSELHFTITLAITMGFLIWLMFQLVSFYIQRGLKQQVADIAREMTEKEMASTGTQRAMLSIMDDLRHEKSRALQLASENQKLATLAEQSSEAMLRLDANGRVEHFNHAAKEMFAGLNQGERQIFSDLFTGEQAAEINRAILLAFHDRAVTNVQLLDIGVAGDGTSHQAIELLFSHLNPDPQNPDHNVSIVARDISSQQREQTQLREIVAQAPNALIVMNDIGTIKDVNERAESLFCYEDVELIGKALSELITSDAFGVQGQLDMKMLQNKQQPEGKDYLAKRANGDEFPVEMGLTPIQVGEDTLIVASIVDITERKKQQAKIEESNQLLKLRNNEMEQFIYTVSHDLKSPLFSINGFTRQLIASAGPSLSDKDNYKLERISDNVSRMGRLLDDLLELSRVLRQELKVEPVDTNSLVKQVFNALDSVIESSSAQINILAPLPLIRANEGMVFQCLQNLIGNAINYRDLDRPLVIEISAEESSDWVNLTVKDNGVGIDPKYHDRIFGIFERLDTREGTGVGLSIVKTIMDRHGGKVLLHSLPDEGATFTLQFPHVLEAMIA